MRARYLIPSVLVTLLSASAAHAIVPGSGAVRTFSPAAFDNGAVEADADALPTSVRGLLPTRDGDPFHLEVDAGAYYGDDDRSLYAALADILPALGYTGDVGALEVSATTRLATPDAAEVEAMLRADSEELERALEARFRELSEVTQRALALQADENYSMMLASRTVLRLEQVVDGLPVPGLGLSVVLDEDGSVIAISGALSNLGRLAGEVRIDEARALELAREAVAEVSLASIAVNRAAAVATGRSLRPAWEIEAVTEGGRDYLITVDAETGELLGVESQSESFANGQGMNFSPDPDSAATLATFEVDDAVGKSFVLSHEDIGAVTTFGADGCDTDGVTVSASSGFADFDVSPINGTVVDVVSEPGYNCQFQEVNAFGRVTSTLAWYRAMGAEPSPFVPIRVDLANACDDGPNQACAGGGMLTFGIGSATLNGDTDPGDLFNLALDETVVIHEIGHHVYRRQVDVGGGTRHGSVSEGLSDYFAMALLDQPSVGDYTAALTGMYVQSGFIPRQADTFDVFPEHVDLGGGYESHANGQMVAFAQWNFRSEMGARSAIGEGLATRILLDALTHTGFGVTNDKKTEQELYGAFQSLLSAQLLEVGYHQARVDLLQAYAWAGVFTTPHEAVIDISDDYLAVGDGPPTFTIWPGEDFSFTAGDASDSANYNTHYEVELANDEDFTLNLVTSGPKNGFSEWASGNTRASWTPSAQDWDTLTGGSVLYYRVRTWDDEGGTKRDSEHTMAGFMAVPTAMAVINDGGSAGCSTAGGRVGGGLGALLALSALARRRR